MIGFKEFDWQGKEIRSFQKQIEEEHMVHALLISGEPGVGKRTLAMLLAKSLMCSSVTGKPCGKCTGCMLADSGEHPDITIVQKGIPLSPDIAKGRSLIPVDDIREMIRLCSQYPYKGGNRVILIADAENLTLQAQNSLLKILEEPPVNTYFLITSSHPEQLLTTVRSRCRPVNLVPWETDYIRKVLTDSGIDQSKADKAASVSAGSIGNAFRFAADDSYWAMRDQIIHDFFANRKRSTILSISSGWKERKSDAEMLFTILEECINRLLRYRFEPDLKAETKEFPSFWIQFAEQASYERFTALSDSVCQARKQNSFNVNFQAIIEQLLLVFIGESDLWAK